MGYGYYVLPDGREAGYTVDATCDRAGCEAEIHRGLDYLCGTTPGESPEDGCGSYFCGKHEFDHDCEHEIALVAGFCPMGCGDTLILVNRVVTCSWSGCKRPDAVSTILADRETEHLVELGERTFSLQHPLRERLDGQLFDCDVHDVIRSLDGPPATPGLYRTTDGDVFERVEVPDGE